MSYYKLIKDFGLSNAMLAKMFHMDPSNFKKGVRYENGRSLSKRASEFLAQAVKLSENLPQGTLSEEESLHEKVERIPFLEGRILETGRKIDTLQVALLEAKNEFVLLDKRKSLIHALLNDPEFVIKEIEMNLLMAERIDITLKLYHVGPSAQEMLQNDIDLLTSKIEKDQALLDKIRNNS